MDILSSIQWDKLNGLIPAIAQDSKTNEVLMCAFMNKESLQLTIQTGYAHYFSRSKQRIWKKGESSGHSQKIVELMLDCDYDCLLLKVEQNGIACHTGNLTCFFNKIDQNSIVKTQSNSIDTTQIYDIFDNLFNTIQDKKFDSTEKSYTASLFAKGENQIGKKIVEESSELAFAIKDKDKKEIIYEAADLFYHTLVGLSFSNITLDEVRTELLRRVGTSGIDEKNSRKK